MIRIKTFFHLLLQFCQPAGWQMTTQKMQPSYFVSVLTDTDAERHYCAVLTFSEDVSLPPTPSNDLADEEEDGITLAGGHVTKLYAPKSLVLISRLSYFETFRVSGETLRWKLVHAQVV
jgi:myotubularin-related protein 5/13